MARHANIQARTSLKVTSLVKRPSELPEEGSLGDAARLPGRALGRSSSFADGNFSVQKQTERQGGWFGNVPVTPSRRQRNVGGATSTKCRQAPRSGISSANGGPAVRSNLNPRGTSFQTWKQTPWPHSRDSSSPRWEGCRGRGWRDRREGHPLLRGECQRGGGPIPRQPEHQSRELGCASPQKLRVTHAER